MIFSNGLDDKVRDGAKTQTRRLVKEGDRLIDWPMPCVFRRTKSGDDVRLMWRVGQTYTIQSGRGKKGNGHFRITEIRKERIQDISEADAIAEGVSKIYKRPVVNRDLWRPNPPWLWMPREAIESFRRLWDSIHKKSSESFESNREVWVLEIEPANGK